MLGVLVVGLASAPLTTRPVRCTNPARIAIVRFANFNSLPIQAVTIATPNYSCWSIQSGLVLFTPAKAGLFIVEYILQAFIIMHITKY